MVTDIWIQWWTEMRHNYPLCTERKMELNRGDWLCRIRTLTPTHTCIHAHGPDHTLSWMPRDFKSENWLIFPLLAESSVSSRNSAKLLPLRTGRWGFVRRDITVPLISWLTFPPATSAIWLFVKAFTGFEKQTPLIYSGIWIYKLPLL